MKLLQHYDVNLTALPRQKQEEYVAGIQKIKALICGSSALPRPLQESGPGYAVVGAFLLATVAPSLDAFSWSNHMMKIFPLLQWATTSLEWK